MAAATAERSAAVEFRVSGRTLTGEAIRYGERALDRPERFTAGAFATREEPLALDIQHDRQTVVATTADRLRVTDTPEALRVEAELLPGSAAQRLVERRALRGLSVAFEALEEHRAGGVRVIDRAHLVGIGLVDQGSYATTVELRALEDAWLRAEIPTASRMACECAGPVCDSVLFEPDSFELGDGSDVLAFGGGGAQNILGSLRRGTLLVNQTRKGLTVGLTERGTDTARRIAEDARAAPMYVRPILDLDQSDFVEDEGLRTFSRASVRAFVVKPTSASDGHRPAVIDGMEARRRRWL